MLMHRAEHKHPMDKPTEEAASRMHRSSSQKDALNWLIRAFFCWFFVYLLLQGQDGFFARAADRIAAGWVKYVFLNVPLQILLALAVAVCAGSERRAVLRLGIWIGALNGLLVLVHIALSVATA